MPSTLIKTKRLDLVLEKLKDTRARIEAMPEDHKTALSEEWLGLLAAATTDDPWILGFNMVRRRDGKVVGQIGFKGPPVERVVEIAYAVEPEEQLNGYATEAALSLTHAALAQADVSCVRAHTLPEKNASGRVLTKCGFQLLGEVIDPEDGPVWRWEIMRA